jgi:hypothetical protein
VRRAGPPAPTVLGCPTCCRALRCVASAPNNRVGLFHAQPAVQVQPQQRAAPPGRLAPRHLCHGPQALGDARVERERVDMRCLQMQFAPAREIGCIFVRQDKAVGRHGWRSPGRDREAQGLVGTGKYVVCEMRHRSRPIAWCNSTAWRGSDARRPSSTLGGALATTARKYRKLWATGYMVATRPPRNDKARRVRAG